MSKFKLGERVEVNSEISPLFNQKETIVTKITTNHTRVGEPYYTYQVRGQPNLAMEYRECSLHKLQPKLTNEQVLALFLKQHRKYAAFKRYLNNHNLHTNALRIYPNTNIPKVQLGLRTAFIWLLTKEDHQFWEDLHKEWVKLCEDFNLEGSITLKDV